MVLLPNRESLSGNFSPNRIQPLDPLAEDEQHQEVRNVSRWTLHMKSSQKFRESWHRKRRRVRIFPAVIGCSQVVGYSCWQNSRLPGARQIVARGSSPAGRVAVKSADVQNSTKKWRSPARQLISKLGAVWIDLPRWSQVKFEANVMLRQRVSRPNRAAKFCQ